MTSNPLEDHSLDGYRLFPVPLEKLTHAALEELGLDAKSMNRCKNFFALGMCYWLYNRPMDHTYQLARRQVQDQAAAGRSQQAGHEGRLQLLRSHRSVSGQLRNSAGQAGSGHLSQSERQSGAGDGLRGSGPEGRAAAVPRLVSDHARVRHSARAFRVQEFRRDDVPGRRRNRRHHFGHRRFLCRRAGASPPLPARAWRSRPKPWAWPSRSNCRW